MTETCSIASQQDWKWSPVSKFESTGQTQIRAHSLPAMLSASLWVTPQNSRVVDGLSRCRQGPAMTNRRVDAIYFILLVVVAGVGYVAANRPVDDVDAMELPDFSLPSLTFTMPANAFELPFHIVKFETAMPTSLALSSNMETALVEVRSALLESSTLVEVRPAQEMLASIE